MSKTEKLFLAWLIVFGLLLVVLAGCATQTPQPDVGSVVVAPRVQLPPPPLIVQQTQPKPAGYFQCLFLTYFGEPCERPTTSTPPTPVAGKMRTP